MTICSSVNRLFFIAPTSRGTIDHLLQRANDTRRRQREIDFDHSHPPVEVTHHIEQPEVATVAESIVHEVHRPDLILRCTLPPSGTGASRTSRFFDLIRRSTPVRDNVVHALVIPAEAFHIAKMQETQPEAPVALTFSHAHQALGDSLVLARLLRLIREIPLTASSSLREDYHLTSIKDANSVTDSTISAVKD